MSDTKVIAIVRDDIPAELKAEMIAQGISPFNWSNVVNKEAAYVSTSSSTIVPRTFLCQGAKQVSRTCVDIHMTINLSILYGMEGFLVLNSKNNYTVTPSQRHAKAIVSIHQYVDGEVNPTYAAAQKYAQQLEDLGDAITTKPDLSVNLVKGSGAFLCAMGLPEPESFLLFEINKVALDDTSNGVYAEVLATNPRNFGDGQTCGVRLVIGKLMLNNISLTATTGSLQRVEETGRTDYTFASLSKKSNSGNSLGSPLDKPIATETVVAPVVVAPVVAKAEAPARAADKPDLNSGLPALF